MPKWTYISIEILGYSLNALLLVGFLYVATTVVNDVKEDNLQYEHTLYRYIVETPLNTDLHT